MNIKLFGLGSQMLKANLTADFQNPLVFANFMMQ